MKDQIALLATHVRRWAPSPPSRMLCAVPSQGACNETASGRRSFRSQQRSPMTERSSVGPIGSSAKLYLAPSVYAWRVAIGGQSLELRSVGEADKKVDDSECNLPNMSLQSKTGNPTSGLNTRTTLQSHTPNSSRRCDHSCRWGRKKLFQQAGSGELHTRLYANSGISV